VSGGAPITEHALLEVVSGREAEFEAAFQIARDIPKQSEGFESLRLLRCVEHPSRYLLLIEWASLEAHTVGFRGSPLYERWRELLDHFYDPFPTVIHFETVPEVCG
jgi:heme-degrading monooxygenase HmoA